MFRKIRQTTAIGSLVLVLSASAFAAGQEYSSKGRGRQQGSCGRKGQQVGRGYGGGMQGFMSRGRQMKTRSCDGGGMAGGIGHEGPMRLKMLQQKLDLSRDQLNSIREAKEETYRKSRKLGQKLGSLKAELEGAVSRSSKEKIRLLGKKMGEIFTDLALLRVERQNLIKKTLNEDQLRQFEAMLAKPDKMTPEMGQRCNNPKKSERRQGPDRGRRRPRVSRNVRKDSEKPSKQDRLNTFFSKKDADSDGKVTLKEFRKDAEGGRMNPEKLFDRLDIDGNGQINREEFEKMAGRRKRHEARDRRKDNYNNVDAEDDTNKHDED